MASTSIHSNNDEENQNNNRQRPLSNATRRGRTTPESFVFGTRSDQYITSMQQEPQHRLTSFYQNNDNDYDAELLKHLSDDFAKLLDRVDTSDCLLNVKGTYMAVHRCILAARSETFAAVISGNVSRLDTDTREQLQVAAEKNKLVISIDKTDPETMKQVIVFLYTGKCQLNERNAYALLDASGRYKIKSLKVHTGRFLINHINTNNVLTLIKGAHKYDNILVKQYCIKYFIDHADEIMGISELWKKFAEEYPSIVAELLHWIVHKKEFLATMSQPDLNSQW